MAPASVSERLPDGFGAFARIDDFLLSVYITAQRASIRLAVGCVIVSAVSVCGFAPRCRLYLYELSHRYRLVYALPSSPVCRSVCLYQGFGLSLRDLYYVYLLQDAIDLCFMYAPTRYDMKDLDLSATLLRPRNLLV